MAHLSSRQSYHDLVTRLNRFPQGAAPTQLLYQILALLFSEEEAQLVARLPLRPFTAARAARIWGVGVAEATARLNQLADKALLVDMPQPGGTR
ncbi:MAG: (Fe-S)-binding protein, partial [Desulfuromonadales bacterium]|nr:(Fe-S)-binding protein [Desulfuromonadales bacterium]